MILDYKEIPKANAGDGLQDTFELFSRDFFEALGFEISQHPSRGADGKKDLIVKEARKGVTGITYITWLVSCKHYAHSGKSVSQDDEPDIVDRLKSHKCDGFIGFYSTISSTSLDMKLKGLKDQIECQIYDREKIESELLRFTDGIKLAKRYFPISIEKYAKENPKPVHIFQGEPEILCENCGKNLLETKHGILAALEYRHDHPKYHESHEAEVYFSCKGICDKILKSKYETVGLYDAGWEDIGDLLIPTVYLRSIMTYINHITKYGVEENVLEKIKNLYINVFPHIARELTDKEKERMISLNQLWSTGLF